MAEVWGAALATVAVGAYSANQAKKGAQQGADAIEGANQAAIDEQRRQFDVTQQNLQPWLDAGQFALGQQQNFLRGDYGAAFRSPDYLARLERGTAQLDAGATAAGNLWGGGADADRISFGQNMATEGLNNYWNRLAGVSGTGQSTANTLGGYGAQMAGNVGNALQSSGLATASAYGQRADANSQLAAGIGGAFNNWYQGNLANNPGGTGWYLGNQPGKG